MFDKDIITHSKPKCKYLTVVNRSESVGSEPETFTMFNGYYSKDGFKVFNVFNVFNVFKVFNVFNVFKVFKVFKMSKMLKISMCFHCRVPK